jgi:radical SAM superfamily enzyme YgiQ (UPF0313 family)
MARIAIVQNLHYEFLGVMYISAVLKNAGHTVDIFVRRSPGACAREVASFAPDIAAFPVTTGSENWALQTAIQIKSHRPTRVLLGAYHPTFFPDILRHEAVDIICRGEAELAVLDLADRIDDDAMLFTTRNCSFKKDGEILQNEMRPLIADLDELPFPDRTLYRNKYPWMRQTRAHFIGGRGCPYRCSFCFNHAYRKLYRGKGPALRRRRTGRVIDEICQAREEFGIRIVFMQDDTLIVDRDWTIRFAQEYGERVSLPFACMIRADLVDAELIQALAEAGCRSAFFGVETGSEELRNSILHKQVSDEAIRRTGALLHEHGIRFRTFNMLNLPRETLEDAFRTIQLNQEIGTDYPWCALYHPYPGTELAQIAKEEGLLSSEMPHPSSTFFRTSSIQSPHGQQCANLQKLFFYAVRFPSLFPIIKRVSRWRLPRLFSLAFLLSYAYSYYRSERITFRDVLRIAWHNILQMYRDND